MVRISQSTHLEKVEHILGSGTGTLDFAVKGENEYYTWEGNEDADWTIKDVASIENIEEDRFILYPDGAYFICEVDADADEENSGPVRCWCE
ncbi:hypothetical protein BG842_02770 [Haladaptatus sp. W1]|uniref:hypothetical protein n=1 Tax=Haladaptatus sp. W1 TaxID=1897478 RepID=UPI00086BBBC0|nr:hypothetical protein [Haladaptatus sp. W1]ODR80201.1 hypothetical protein BG842_02770 [Haladaptatus sp. W1]